MLCGLPLPRRLIAPCTPHAGLLYGGCIAVFIFVLSDGSWETVDSHDCTWRISSTTMGMLAFTAFAGLWSWELCFAIRFHVVSLTTGIWYFESASDAHRDAAGSSALLSGSSAQRNPVCTSLGLAFSKSFGSLCLGSLIITIAEMLKRMARQARRNNGLAGVLVACCIQCIMNWIQFLTRFAITFHALTGEDFCSSARTFANHLSRHGFGVVVVDEIARIVFFMGNFTLSLIVGAATGYVAYDSMTDPAGAREIDQDLAVPAAVILGVIALTIAFFFLSFISGILLNVVDASFACLVLDLDHGAKRQPAMAVTIMTIVQPTYVIQQPGQGAPVIAVPVGNGGANNTSAGYQMQDRLPNNTSAGASTVYPNAVAVQVHQVGYPQAVAYPVQSPPMGTPIVRTEQSVANNI